MSRKFRIKDNFNRNRALLLLTFCPVSTWLVPACTTVEAFVLTVSSDSSLIVSQACDSGGEVGHSLFTLSSLSPLHLLVSNTILIVLECKYNSRLNQPKQQRLQALISLSKAFHHWLRREEIKFTWLTVQPWIYALIPHCGPGHFVCCNWKNMKVASYNIWSPLAIPLENVNSSNFRLEFSLGRIKQKKSHWGWGMINKFILFYSP